jgi:energy-converting hydrogenase Eha subunit C
MMNQLLKRVHDIGVVAWVRFVQALNWIALSVGGLVVAVNSMYPQAVAEATKMMPPVAKLLVLAVWAGLVHYALRRAAKAA